MFCKNRSRMYLFIVSMVIISMLAGCSSDTVKESGNTGAKGKTITLNLNHFMSPMHPVHAKILDPFAKELKEKTEGRVEIVIHPNNGLAAPPDTMDAVESGIVDIGFVLPAYTPGRYRLSTFLEFPFMFKSALQANMTAKEMFNILQEHDYKSMKLLWFGGTDIGDIFLKKPAATVDSLKGLKLRSPGPIYNDVIKTLNAVEVSLPVSDLYDALDRGICDGTFMAPTALTSFKLNEVVSQIVQVHMYSTPLVMTMNKNSWNKLSDGDKKIMEGLLAQFPEKIGKLYDADVEHAVNAAKAKGVKFTQFSNEEMDKFHKLVEPLKEKWIADMEAKGLPGKSTYELVKKNADKYK